MKTRVISLIAICAFGLITATLLPSTIDRTPDSNLILSNVEALASGEKPELYCCAPYDFLCYREIMGSLNVYPCKE